MISRLKFVVFFLCLGFEIETAFADLLQPMVVVCNGVAETVLIQRYLMAPYAIVSDGFPDKPYPSENCTVRLENTRGKLQFFFVDYVALNAEDTLEILEENKQKFSINHLHKDDPTHFFSTTKNVTIKLTTKAASRSTVGFRVWTWLEMEAPEANIEVAKDCAFGGSQITSNISLNSDGDLLLAHFDYIDGKPLVITKGDEDLCEDQMLECNVTNDILTPVISSMNGENNVVSVSSLSATAFLYRQNAPPTTPTPSELNLEDGQFLSLQFPDSTNLYENSIAQEFVIHFEGENWLQFEFFNFETEDGVDFLHFVNKDNETLLSLTGALRDGNGNDYPDANSSMLDDITFPNVQAPFTLRFESNGNVRGLGFSCKMHYGNLVTFPTTTPLPTTTAFTGPTDDETVGADAPVNVTVEGNKSSLWKFKPDCADIWLTFVLRSPPTLFNNTKAQLIVFQGFAAAPATPADILFTYDADHLGPDTVIDARQQNQPISVRFTGDPNFLDTLDFFVVGQRFWNSSFLNTTETFTLKPGEGIVPYTTYNFPHKIYNGSVGVFHFVAGSPDTQLFFLLDQYGSSFTDGAAQLSVYRGNQMDVNNLVIKYTTPAQATANTSLSFEAGENVTVVFHGLRALVPQTPAGMVGFRFYVIPFNAQSDVTAPTVDFTSTTTESSAVSLKNSALLFLCPFLLLILDPKLAFPLSP